MVCIANAIVDSIPNSQKDIESLKEQEFSVIGYVKKSPGDEEEEKRIKLLQQVICCLLGKKRKWCSVTETVPQLN